MARSLSSREAWTELAADPTAQLIDVRTDAEWRFVGVPDLERIGRQAALIPWQEYPDMRRNERFLERLAEAAPPDAKLYFLCRSGARSQAAAELAEAAGYGGCVNVIDGFEGGLDEDGHRGRREGWKAAGLPWRQG